MSRLSTSCLLKKDVGARHEAGHDVEKVGRWSPHFAEAAAVDRLPALAGEVEQAAGGVAGDAVEHEVAAVDVDLRPLVGGHPVPEPAQIGDAVDASARRVDAHDVP